MTDLRAPAFRLPDRYLAESGRILAGGLHALVRLPRDLRRLDRREGLRTGMLISGYEGSPLGGYDKELMRHAKDLDELGIVFRPAVNEELAANAVLGSQLVATLQGRTADGVTGIWYGKAPGLDRATDAIRHGNLGGASALGGVLALVGDDATAKSSTVPSSSEAALIDLGMPVLVPADAADILHLGIHGVHLSRFSGLWSAMKLATNVVDGVSTLDLPQVPAPLLPSREIEGRIFTHQVTARFLQPHLAALEESLVEQRPELARRYAAANDLNAVIGDPDARVGIIAAGLTYLETREALARLGYPPESMRHSGIRLLKLGMISPLDARQIRDFAAGLREIVVVEEKRGPLEAAVKALLYGRVDAPAVSGKDNPAGRRLLRAHGDLPAEVIALALKERLTEVLGAPPPAQRTPGEAVVRGGSPAGPGAAGSATAASSPRPVPPRRELPLSPLAKRTPYFCSGCPHNRSTATPAGSLVAAGIGCHTLVVFMDDSRVGDVVGFTQMGGEGAAWIGISPFVTDSHLVQNLGDGTYHHSGSLAVRASVAAGSNITYRILCNGAVAMTGGQEIVGGMSVPALAAELLAEGVRRVVITTEDPGRYRGVKLPPGVSVRDRDALDQVLSDLAGIEGVTALLHDQECATELRRKRKRDLVSAPATRAFINERVCEGCGDCGAKSNCLSVQPVATDYGRKTRIHQGSCNQDYSCFDGDCPSFIEVTPDTGGGSVRVADIASQALPEPPPHTHHWPVHVRLMGIGGTGIVTTAQVLAVAATNAGLHVRGLDQLGLSQKAGPVVSDLRLHTEAFEGANRVGAAGCDLYLGADLLVAADAANLSTASASRTMAIVSTTTTPTGAMVADPTLAFPDSDALRARIADHVAHLRTLDAGALTVALFGSDQLANTFLLGVAAQSGVLPVPVALIEDALRQNGIAVEANIQAFRWGRQYAADPSAVTALTGGAPGRHPRRAPHPRAPRLVAAAGLPVHGALGELLCDRTSELIAYQDAGYAREYLRHIGHVARREEERLGDTEWITPAAARHLFTLMAYKDEYEVARLSIDPAVAERIAEQFGDGARYSFRLHPPLLRALGMNDKVALGSWALPALRGLYGARRLRGTPLDPFGRTRVRMVERELIGEYVAALAHATSLLTPGNRERVLAVVELPSLVRGYEEIKLANVARYRTALGVALLYL